MLDSIFLDEILLNIVVHFDVETLRKYYYRQDLLPLGTVERGKRMKHFLEQRHVVDVLSKSWNLEKYKPKSFGVLFRMIARKRLFDERNSLDVIVSNSYWKVLCSNAYEAPKPYTHKCVGRSKRLDVIERLEMDIKNEEGMCLVAQCMYWNVEKGLELIDDYTTPGRSRSLLKIVLRWREFYKGNGKIIPSAHNVTSLFRYAKWEYITINPENETFECICIRSGRPEYLKNPNLVPEKVRSLFPEHKVYNEDGTLWKDNTKKRFNFPKNAHKFSKRRLARYNLCEVIN